MLVDPSGPKSSVVTALPGQHAPVAGFDEPFALLDACHERVRRSLALLQRLLAHVQSRGVDAHARTAAHDVLRYFSLAAPAHHEDEERHVLPLLRASGDAALQALALRLLDDHAAIRQSWSLLAPHLQALNAGSAVDLETMRGAVAAFIAAHDGHLEREDALAFPAAARLAAAQPGLVASIGNEMAVRRGVTPPQPGG